MSVNTRHGLSAGVTKLRGHSGKVGTSSEHFRGDNIAHCYSFRPEFYVQPLFIRNLRDLRAQGIDLIGGGFQAIGDNVDLILQTAGFTDEQTDPLSPKELFDLFKTVTDESFGKVEEIKN